MKETRESTVSKVADVCATPSFKLDPWVASLIPFMSARTLYDTSAAASLAAWDAATAIGSMVFKSSSTTTASTGSKVEADADADASPAATPKLHHAPDAPAQVCMA